ncbi:MAG TPA: DinB family protein [Gemmatimonadaceae bacterium]|nr:DinB family protein [Gemmatimonadaceae bacterium]
MHFRAFYSAAAIMLLPAIAPAQSNPVAAAFRENAKEAAKNLIAASEELPGDKYGFKPTPAQMSFGDIVGHLSQGNDYLCGNIGGMKAPARSKIPATATKAVMMARLKETFAFCDQALGGLTDAKLAEPLPWFDGSKKTRAWVMTATTADWADHYSQQAIYLRLNGKLPPTAKKP